MFILGDIFFKVELPFKHQQPQEQFNEEQHKHITQNREAI